MSFIDNVVDVMEEAVKDILNNSDIPKEKVNNAREYVKTKLDWKYLIPKFVTYMKELL